MTTSPVTTITVFRFPRGKRGWAFAQMALARPLLAGVPGMRFRKLMGTGRGLGFTMKPDWGRYALLAVWESPDHARRWTAGSSFMRRYERYAEASSTIFLETLAAHGSWDGANPFVPGIVPRDTSAGPVAVLTRATIRLSRLRAFWSQVAPVSARLAAADGLLGSIGIGEVPLVRQATFSLWASAGAIDAFAYRTDEHREVIRRVRDESWYREELFARFGVLEVVGEFP